MGYNLIQTNPAYELVKDVVVGTATTTVDFTGLNITKDDDYMLVSSIINTTASDSNIYSFINSNTTISNYYTQVLTAYSTTVGGARLNYPRFSFVYANSKTIGYSNIKLTNNSYYTFQTNASTETGTSSVGLHLLYGNSTFTATSITSLSIVASVSNAIGIGSRFQLYKRVAPIVFDYTVSSATTSVDITGFTMDKGSEYMLVGNYTGSAYIYVNNNVVNTNYYSQYVRGASTTVDANRFNSPYINISNASFAFSNIRIKLTNNGYFVYQCNTTSDIYNPSSLQMQNLYGTSTFNTTSITQLTLKSSDIFGVGSRFQLIKLK